MAGKIKGITVEIGGSTTGLDKALKGTNAEIKNTQSELKQVEKLLKLDPTNTELLKQKQQLLKQAVGETKDKLDALTQAEKSAKEQLANGSIGEEQFRALQREIVSTESSLKSLENQSKTSNATMAKIGTTAQTISEKTRALSAAAGGLLVGLGASAVKAGQTADDLNVMAKQTGFSTEELQKFSYASDIVDVSMDNIAGSLTKMKRNMASSSSETQEAWKKIGVSVTNADGSMRNATDVFYDALQGLSQVGNETERDQLAMKIFGKSADELAGIVDDGGKSLKELGNKAKDTGLIMSQDAVDGANKFQDSMDELKATALADFGKIGGSLAQDLIPMMEKLVAVVSGVLGWFAQLDPTTKGIIITIIALVAAISPIAGIIGSINAIMLISPTTWIILGIVAAVALLVAGIVWLAQNFEQVKAGMEQTFSKIQYAGEMCWYGIQTHFVTAINAIIWYLNDRISSALTLINLVIDGINQIPGVNVKHLNFQIGYLNTPEMPQMAGGGILNYGSAIVGENGAEILTSAGGRAQVTPLTGSNGAKALGGNISDILKGIDGLNSTMNEMLNSEKTLKLNEREVGRVIRNYG